MILSERLEPASSSMPALWRWENSPREQEEQECPEGSASVSPAGTGMAQGSGAQPPPQAPAQLLQLKLVPLLTLLLVSQLP